MATTVTRNGGQKKRRKKAKRRGCDDARYAERFCNPKIIRERGKETGQSNFKFNPDSLKLRFIAEIFFIVYISFIPM